MATKDQIIRILAHDITVIVPIITGVSAIWDSLPDKDAKALGDALLHAHKANKALDAQQRRDVIREAA